MKHISFLLLGLMACLLAPLHAVEQTISLPQIGIKKTTDAPFSLAATTDSGLPLTYEVVVGPVTVGPDGTVTLSGGEGAVTIKISQAGDGTFDAAESYATFLVNTTEWVSVASGDNHNLAIRSDGTLWAWGRNHYGQLGDGTTTERRSPVQIGSDSDWSSVTCGASHTVALRSDDTLWAWGRNNYGQLGDDTTTQRSSPVQIGSATIWSSVATGERHTVALRSDGTLWAWGDNSYGQLGDGSYTRRISPIQIGSATDWSFIACGDRHTVAVREDGTLWAWGWNSYGQLGDGTNMQRISPVQIGGATDWSFVAGGYQHTVALRSDGTLWAWGRNNYGQLGDDTNTSRSSPVQIANDTDWSSVACRSDHTVALRSDGTLWAWGDNSYGQLGDGSYTRRISPIQIGSAADWSSVVGGSSYTVALRSDGTLWAWGDNNYGQLGDGTTTQRASPVQIGSATDWSSVAGGNSHTVALRSDGTLWAWGNNNHGQLGDGTTIQRNSPVQIGSATDWSSVAAGHSHTVALRSDGTLWAWGWNSYDQLGDGTNTSRSSPVRIGIATDWSFVAGGYQHTVALRSDGTLWAWGRNNYGQLGDDTTTQRISPVQIGSATDWSSVACGNSHTVALRSNGTLWAWGRNNYGQLGDSTNIQRNSPVQIGSAADWSSVACGVFHTVALRSGGTLWAWGYNSFGQLGNGTYTQRNSPVKIGSAIDWSSVTCGAHRTVALRSDGTLWAWGYNYDGRLGDGTTTSRLRPFQIGSAAEWPSIACGSSHTLGLRSDGTLWAWGQNSNGQLGYGYENITPRRALPARVQQTLTFPAPVLSSGSSVALAATSTSGLPVSYFVTGAGTLDGNTLVAAGPGTIWVTALQAGDDTWDAAEPIRLAVEGLPAPVLVVKDTSGNTYASGDTLNFGTQTIGDGVPINLQIRNDGSADLSVELLPLSGDYSHDGVGVDTVTPGNFDAYVVSFEPSEAGSIQAVLEIQHDAANAPSPFILNLTGVGSVPSYIVTFDLDGKATRVGGGSLSQMIETNQAALAPSVSANAGWIFTGWDVSFTDITAPITVTAQFTEDLNNLQPGQSVTTSANRVPSPPSANEVTVELGDLTLEAGSNFGLGFNETLVLTDGPLTIEAGAIFQGNGSIIGDVINAGLVIIRIVEETILPNLTSNSGIFSIIREDRATPLVIDSPVGNTGVFATDGSLEVTGTFTQTSTGTLRLFMQGENPGIDYSQLTVGDTVDLDGELQVVLNQAKFDPFTLDAGDSFDLVRIDPLVSGKFIVLQPGLGYRIMATQTIAGQMTAAGLTTTPYVGLANDPDDLVELDGSLFSFALVAGDTVLRATFQGIPPTASSLTIHPLMQLGSDTDPGSDAWELANGFDPNVDGDVTSKDTDGDGDLDILELFQGTLGTPGAPAFSYGNPAVDPSTGALAVGFRRGVGAPVNAEGEWSPDMVNWYTSGETAPGGIRVSFTEEVNDMGSYELVDVSIALEEGTTPQIFYRLQLSPNE